MICPDFISGKVWRRREVAEVWRSLEAAVKSEGVEKGPETREREVDATDYQVIHITGREMDTGACEIT